MIGKSLFDEEDDFADFQCVQATKTVTPFGSASLGNASTVRNGTITGHSGSFQPDFSALSQLDELRKQQLNPVQDEDDFGDFVSVSSQPTNSTANQMAASTDRFSALGPQDLTSTLTPTLNQSTSINVAYPNGGNSMYQSPKTGTYSAPSHLTNIPMTPLLRSVAPKPKDLSDLLGPFLANEPVVAANQVTSTLPVNPSSYVSETVPQAKEDLDFVATFPNASLETQVQVDLVPTADRYDVFRDIDVNSATKQSHHYTEDDFGDFTASNHVTSSLNKLDNESIHSFESASEVGDSSSPPVVIKTEEDVLMVWTQMVQAVKQLIHKSFNTLVVNHGQDCSIEAMSSFDGHKFRNDLEQVYLVAKRIEHAFKSKPNSHAFALKSQQLTKLLEDIEITYKTLTKLFLKCSKSVDGFTMEAAGSKYDPKCTICRSNLKIGVVTLIIVSGFNYHSSCANLWMNHVSNSLPVNSDVN